MTTYVAVYVAAWAMGFVVGYQVRIIRLAVNASN